MNDLHFCSQPAAVTVAKTIEENQQQNQQVSVSAEANFRDCFNR